MKERKILLLVVLMSFVFMGGAISLYLWNIHSHTNSHFKAVQKKSSETQKVTKKFHIKKKSEKSVAKKNHKLKKELKLTHYKKSKKSIQKVSNEKKKKKQLSSKNSKKTKNKKLSDLELKNNNINDAFDSEFDTETDDLSLGDLEGLLNDDASNAWQKLDKDATLKEFISREITSASKEAELPVLIDDEALASQDK